MRVITTQLAELAVIARHLEAMDAEMMTLRASQDWHWGDGMWTSIPEIEVFTDADEPLGKFSSVDYGGFDWGSA